MKQGIIRRASAFAAMLLGAYVSAAAAQDLPTIRLGALAYGTVNWELDTIKARGLDEKHGFQLDVIPMGNGSASDIAFLGGEIDVMVSDVIWAAAQRAEGRDLKFIPYSTSVGGIMVKPDSGIQTIAELTGKSLGIAGGPLDKSWLILQAYALQQGQMDLAEATRQEFGAPPVMFKAALSGQVDGVINFWHFQAKAKAAGMREIISVQEAAAALGLNPQTPLLGYILNGDMAPELAQALFAASRDAKAILQSDPAAWEALRERMNPANEAQFIALKDGFLAGIPQETTVDPDGVTAMLELMGRLGGPDLVGKATTLPDGLFVDFDGE